MNNFGYANRDSVPLSLRAATSEDVLKDVTDLAWFLREVVADASESMSEKGPEYYNGMDCTFLLLLDKLRILGGEQAFPLVSTSGVVRDLWNPGEGGEHDASD